MRSAELGEVAEHRRPILDIDNAAAIAKHAAKTSNAGLVVRHGESVFAALAETAE